MFTEKEKPDSEIGFCPVPNIALTSAPAPQLNILFPLSVNNLIIPLHQAHKFERMPLIDLLQAHHVSLVYIIKSS